MIEESEFLRQYLAGRDVPCPMCEYNLRDLVGDRCPECGDQLTLQVNPVEPKQAAAITGLILLAAGAGLNGLLLIYTAALNFMQQGMGDDSWKFLCANGGGFVVEALAITIWISRWKRIRRLSPLLRWSLALAPCSLLTLADLAVFIKVIR